MMLQGFNMLSIARLGGHSQLEIRPHYHKHLDHFASVFCPSCGADASNET